MATEEKKDFDFEEEETNNKGDESSNIEKENDESNESGKQSGKESAKSAKSGKMFTQEQVNKMMAREKNQGRNAAYREFGIDPKNANIVNQFKAFIESQKTDDEKAAEKEAEDRAKQEENERRVMIAETKAEAMMMGVKTQYVEDAVTLVLAKISEDSDTKTLLGELKTKYPAWFGESEEKDKKDEGKKENQKTGNKGTGSSIKNVNKNNKDGEAKGLGARLAAQRKSKNSGYYWGKK